MPSRESENVLEVDIHHIALYILFTSKVITAARTFHKQKNTT